MANGRELDRVVEDEGRLDQLRLDPLREQPVDQLAPALPGVGLGPHRLGQRLAGRVLGDVDAGALEDRLAQGDPPPGRRQVDLGAVALDLRRPQDPLGDLGDQQLEVVGGLLVVGVGLVPLEHRELGVVLRRDALIAEVLAQLVDPVDAADDAALQVELGRDPQVEVAVERVVVGGERPRQRAAVERLQHRRLDLDEAALVEPAPDLGTVSARIPNSRASPGWRSGRARAGGSGSRCPPARGTCLAAAAGSWPAAASGYRQRELPAPGGEGLALDPDDVAEVEMDQQLEGLRPEQVLAGVQLDLAAAVAQVEEGRLAVAAACDDPARDPVGRLGLDPRRQALVRGPDLGDLLAVGEIVRERLDARLPQALELPRRSARRSPGTCSAGSGPFGSLIAGRAYPPPRSGAVAARVRSETWNGAR